MITYQDIRKVYNPYFVRDKLDKLTSDRESRIDYAFGLILNILDRFDVPTHIELTKFEKFMIADVSLNFGLWGMKQEHPHWKEIAGMPAWMKKCIDHHTNYKIARLLATKIMGECNDQNERYAIGVILSIICAD